MINSVYSEPLQIGVPNPKIDLPINEWWGIQAGRGADASWQSSYERMLDRFLDLFPERYGSTRRLTADEANNLYSIPGKLKFDRDVDERDAEWQFNSTKKAIFEDEMIRNAQHQAGIWRGLTGIGASMAGNMFNSQFGANIDFGLSMMPMFGVSSKSIEAAKAAGYAAPGIFGVKQGLAEIAFKGGIIGIDAAKLGPLAKAPLFTESVLNGVSAAGIGELVTLADKFYREEQATALDYATGVLNEGAMSGAFHLVMRGVGKAAIKTLEVFEVITPQTQQEIAARAGLKYIIGDDTIDPAAPVRADEGVLEATAKAKKAEADQEFAFEKRLTIRPQDQPLIVGPNELLYLVQAESSRQSGSAAGNYFDSLLERFYAGERNIELFEEMASAVDRSYDPTSKSPQDAFFVERVFGGEKAAAITRANELLAQIEPQIRTLNRALSDLGKEIRNITNPPEPGQVPPGQKVPRGTQIKQELTSIDDRWSELKRDRDALLYEKWKNPVYSAFYDQKLEAIIAEIQKLNGKRSTLRAEFSNIEKANGPLLKKLKENYAKIQKELFDLEESRAKYGTSLDIPQQLLPEELNAQLKEQSEFSARENPRRAERLSKDGISAEIPKQIAAAQKSIAEIRAQKEEIRKVINELTDAGKVDELPSLLDEIKKLDTKESQLISGYRRAVARMDIAEAKVLVDGFSKRRAELTRNLKAATEANNVQEASDLRKQIIELDLESRSAKDQLASAKEVLDAIESADKIASYESLIADLKAMADEATASGKREEAVSINQKRKAVETEFIALKEKLQKESKPKTKSSPLSKNEVEGHSSRRRIQLEGIIQQEREAAVRSMIDAEDPKAKAKKDTDDARRVVIQLSKGLDSPRTKPFLDAAGKAEAELAAIEAANAELLSDMSDTIKRLEDAAKAPEGKVQTRAQVEMQGRAERMRAMLEEAERLAKEEVAAVEMEKGHLMQVINCMIVNNVE